MVTELARLIRERQLSSVELVKLYLDRISRPSSFGGAHGRCDPRLPDPIDTAR